MWIRRRCKNIFKKSHGFPQIKMQYVKLKNSEGVNRKLKEQQQSWSYSSRPFLKWNAREGWTTSKHSHLNLWDSILLIDTHEATVSEESRQIMCREILCRRTSPKLMKNKPTDPRTSMNSKKKKNKFRQAFCSNCHKKRGKK